VTLPRLPEANSRPRRDADCFTTNDVLAMRAFSHLRRYGRNVDVEELARIWSCSMRALVQLASGTP
jgi:hypothetical protein